MDELNVLCSICIEKRDGEESDETVERLKSILDSELCNLADHRIYYEIHEVFEQRRDDCESTAETGFC